MKEMLKLILAQYRIFPFFLYEHSIDYTMNIERMYGCLLSNNGVYGFHQKCHLAQGLEPGRDCFQSSVG